MKKSLLLTLVIALIVSPSWAQSFVPGFTSFSGKKTTYITLEDGTTLEGRLKSLKFKKGLIEELKIKDLNDKKIKIDPEDIKFMYVPPSGLQKLSNRLEAVSDLKKLQDGELTTQYLDDGYMYMEKSKVRVKAKKTGSYMMQLVNPSYSGKIKIYNDPKAKEGASIGVAGMKVAGGLEKSYYMKKKGEDVAIKITKKEYKKEMAEIFAECPELLKKYGENPNWSEFEMFIYDYSIMCN
ncbi:MAG: hypothetical protein L3J29_12400 [Cyclobacteriaceae bacterium]|nr:hypothetical protein [Cyclobacteriaceae bacterium]